MGFWDFALTTGALLAKFAEIAQPLHRLTENWLAAVESFRPCGAWNMVGMGTQGAVKMGPRPDCSAETGRTSVIKQMLSRLIAAPMGRDRLGLIGCLDVLRMSHFVSTPSSLIQVSPDGVIRI